ncbi:uncharacterized protein LOC117644670 [Thrips palmi]|uniref:Uncharacterized protein LOC117644670 n=1 Tax=Thrips palmi TaxID=161013 RepID=A0A6P8YJX6_THRPL|nr:uncharacterized protein LOC117644670 [Thrips palmi]
MGHPMSHGGAWDAMCRFFPWERFPVIFGTTSHGVLRLMGKGTMECESWEALPCLGRVPCEHKMMRSVPDLDIVIPQVPPLQRPANPFAYNVSSELEPQPAAATTASIVAIGFVQRPGAGAGPSAQLPPPGLKKHMHSAQGHFGPYFEDGAGPHNATARVGSAVTLNCRVGMLQDKTVTWVHRRGDQMHLLTVGGATYSSDQRLALRFRYPNDWRLEISPVTLRDQGRYECQVTTHPLLARIVNLRVTAPDVQIVDENMHPVSERYYKAGSAVELTCLAGQLEGPGDTVHWSRGRQPLSAGVSTNASTLNGRVVSTLTLRHAQKKDSGNYSCSVGSLAGTSVAVHVLNGELPAAVHDGNSGVTSNRVATWLLALVQCSQLLASGR